MREGRNKTKQKHMKDLKDPNKLDQPEQSLGIRNNNEFSGPSGMIASSY